MPYVSPGSAESRVANDSPLARFLWSNIAKPVVRTAAAPVLGFATGVKNLAGSAGDVTLKVPGTSTTLRPGISGEALVKGTSKNKVVRQEGIDALRRQSAEQLSDAANTALTLLPGAGMATTKIGTKVASGIASRGGGKVLQTLGKVGTQAVGDYATGSVVGAASSVAGGEKDPLKILEQANATGLFGAALPIGFSAVGASIPVVRSGAARVLLGDSKAKFGDALEAAEKGWVAKRAADELKAKTARNDLIKIKSKDGSELIQKRRYAQDNLTAPNADRGVIRNKLSEIADTIKGGAEAASAATVRTVRRLDQNFLNSEAPIEVLATKMQEVDPESAALMRKAQSEFQAKTDIAAGNALATHDEITNGILKGDPRLQSALDQVSDVRTKLETIRDSATPEARAAMQADLDRTLNQLSPAERTAVEEAHKATIRANEANLDRLVEGGIISSEKAAMLKEKNPNYSRLLVREYMEGKSNTFGGRSSDRVLKETGLKSRKTGADLDLDTLGASEANALNHAMTEERVMTNLRNQSIVDADMKNGTGMFNKVNQPSENAVTVFRNGEKEFYEPTDPRLAEYFKKQNETGLEAPKFVEALSNFTKKFATQLNPVFTIKNFMRDQQDRLANIGLGFSPKRLARATYEAGEHVAGRPTELTLRAARLGGPLSSAGYDMSSGFRRLADKSKKTGVAGKIKELAETSELATRINILQEAEAAGITDPEKLRDLMRNGTLDFSIGGDMAKEVNKWIPFTTAAINGLRTQLKSLAKDPAGYARRQQILAVYPQLLLDAHNKQYQSASTIPQNDRNLNHIFVYGEGVDSEGRKFPKYFKIPKGQATRLFANITRIITNEGLEPKEMSGYIMEQFGTMIPVINTGSQTPVPTPFGSIGQALYGIQTNKDYMGRDIVSQGNLSKAKLGQTNKFTSDLAKDSAKALANVTGIELSPAKMEYFFRTAGSGLGSTVLSAANNAYDAARGKELTGTQDGSLTSKLASAAVTQGFVGTSNSDVDLSVTAKNESAVKADQDADFELAERYRSNMDEMKNAKTQEEKEAVLKDLKSRGELTPDFVKYVIAESKKKKGVFSVDPTASSNMKAIQMSNYLNSLDSVEEQAEAIKGFGAQNLLTPDVQDSLVAYKLYKKLNGTTQGDAVQMIQQFEEGGLLNDNVKRKMLEYKKGKAP